MFSMILSYTVSIWYILTLVMPVAGYGFEDEFEFIESADSVAPDLPGGLV